MLTCTNLRVRLNKDSASPDMLGWVECVLDDTEHRFYINNIRVKAKEIDGSFTVRLEFPSKTIVAGDGTDKKVFFVKPINAKAYSLVKDEVIKYLKGLTNVNKGV